MLILECLSRSYRDILPFGRAYDDSMIGGYGRFGGHMLDNRMGSIGRRRFVPNMMGSFGSLGERWSGGSMMPRYEAMGLGRRVRPRLTGF
jgi:hypothetical protein